MTTLKMGPVETIPNALQAVIKTAYGAVRGSVADGVNTFRGIPYAAPPFGANRLRPPALAGPNPPRQLADMMHAAWVAFARTGNPGWPRYDLTRRATMRFDTASEVVDDPRATERVLWEGVR